MITEIEVTAEINGYDLAVVFRTKSMNDGGQSDAVSEPIYFIDGQEYSSLGDIYDENLAAFLNDMFDDYQNYAYTEKEIQIRNEWDD